MTEAFLHYIWQHQLFDHTNLLTTDGLSVNIINPGEYNTHSGPDFFSAHIRINETLWVGTVEIHLKASEWKKHHHELDAAYDNCILHVVFESDAEACRKNGQQIFCLELKNRFSDKVWNNYQNLLGTHAWIPCSHRIKEIDSITLNSWLDRLSVDRLERKTENVFHLLESNNNNWEETFYQFLCSGFGFQLNSLPFLMLSRQLPFNLIQRYRDKPVQLESLLFGCAGFLDQAGPDQYSNYLRELFENFKNAHSLKIIDVSCWKFLRLRPVNFPTVRLSQLATLFSKTNHLFSQVLEMDDWNSGKHLFDVKASEYWDSHFLFGKESKGKSKFLGQKSVENIFINVIIPVLFAYGIRCDSSIHRHRALKILEQIPPEDNSIIRNWASEGIVPNSALQTQALLELNKNHCSAKKCLTCRIGIKLINNLP